MPWSLDWYRTSVYLKDGTWEHEVKGNRKQFYDSNIWGNKIYYEEHPYKYKLTNGETQRVIAKIHKTEREWRRRWLKFTPIFNFVRTTIEVNFSDEVGERSGSWKGGTIGCGYDLKGNESMGECLKRMEMERKFN